MAEENIGLSLEDTPRSRRAVTEVFTDDAEKKSLQALLESAQRTLADPQATSPDRNSAARIIKDFIQLKHGKKEVDVPHFRLSVKTISGDYVELSQDGKTIIGVRGKPLPSASVKSVRAVRTGKTFPVRGGNEPSDNPAKSGNYTNHKRREPLKPSEEIRTFPSGE